jgi:hypothetical protein
MSANPDQHCMEGCTGLIAVRRDPRSKSGGSLGMHRDQIESQGTYYRATEQYPSSRMSQCRIPRTRTQGCGYLKKSLMRRLEILNSRLRVAHNNSGQINAPSPNRSINGLDGLDQPESDEDGLRESQRPLGLPGGLSYDVLILGMACGSEGTG